MTKQLRWMTSPDTRLNHAIKRDHSNGGVPYSEMLCGLEIKQHELQLPSNRKQYCNTCRCKWERTQ